MEREFVQDFDGEKADEKTILERKVMEGKEFDFKGGSANGHAGAGGSLFRASPSEYRNRFA